MLFRLMAAVALAAAMIVPGKASAEANVVRVAKQFGVAYMQYMVMQELKLIEKHAKAAGLDVTTEWATFRSSDVMNDALISGSVDFVSLGIPGIITIWSKTKGTAVEVKGVAGLNVSPLMLMVRDPAIKSIKDFKDNHRIAMPAVKVSMQAIMLQMAAAKEFGDAKFGALDHLTVSMAHPDAVIALLAGSTGISAHFSSPPFHQRERMDPRVRTILTSDDVMGGSTTFTMISTTSKFRQENPQVFAAVLKALEEANRMIVADKKMAADLLVATEGGGLSPEEILEVLNDPHVKFTTTPENVMKYAEFMNDAGSLKNRPASWKDLFFPEIHGAPGS